MRCWPKPGRSECDLFNIQLLCHSLGNGVGRYASDIDDDVREDTLGLLWDFNDVERCDDDRTAAIAKIAHDC